LDASAGPIDCSLVVCLVKARHKSFFNLPENNNLRKEINNTTDEFEFVNHEYGIWTITRANP
jgi:hypothetical protein